MEQIEEKIKRLYGLANAPEANTEITEAVDIIKYLRRSQGQYNRRKEEYKTKVKESSEMIATLSLEIEEYQQKIQDLAVQKKQAMENLNTATRELERIDTEIKVAIARVKQEKTWFGKFTRLLEVIRTLFLEEEEVQNLLAVDYSDLDKPQMNTDIASIQRNLLDK
jgi:chromosome segregation ATPase